MKQQLTAALHELSHPPSRAGTGGAVLSDERQITIGDYLKEQGMTQVDRNTPDEWKNEFQSAAARVLESHGSVTADDVIQLVGFPPNHVNSVGAQMSRFAKQRGLVPTYEKARRASRHSAIVCRWHAATGGAS